MLTEKSTIRDLLEEAARLGKRLPGGTGPVHLLVLFGNGGIADLEVLPRIVQKPDPDRDQ